MNIRACEQIPVERRVEGLTRDEACALFARRIRGLARRVARQAGADCPFHEEDLVGYGVLGLLGAFERFEPTHRVDFASFASYRILGQMLDAVRGAAGSTRRERQIARDLTRVTGSLEETLGRAPSHDELAAGLGVDVDTCWRMRTLAVPLSFEPMTLSTDALGKVEAEGPRTLLAQDTRRALREAIVALPERERRTVLLYYTRGWSLAEIGANLDVTPSRVCQILSGARVRLRKAIGRDFDLDAFSFEGAAWAGPGVRDLQ